MERLLLSSGRLTEMYLYLSNSRGARGTFCFRRPYGVGQSSPSVRNPLVFHGWERPENTPEKPPNSSQPIPQQEEIAARQYQKTNEIPG
jgi:hypothetical protein